MTPTDQAQQDLGLTTGRIETLTDGVFAIAMTLLVLNLGLPQLSESLSSGELHSLLPQQAHKFFNYALSFVLLALFKMPSAHIYLLIPAILFLPPFKR